MLVLASKSPRRRELLALYTECFEISVAECEEGPFCGGDVADYVMSLAEMKAEAVARERKNDTVIGADTVVAYRGEVLGKPRNEAHAKEMLTSMSGGTQEVYTGVCVISHGEKKLFAEKTYVSFRPLSEREIDDYIATGESLDKAGAYGIQGGAGEFVSSVRGDYFNVIGLPMKKTALVLEEILKTHSEW